MSEVSPQRIALVLNALTGQELQAGNRDVSRIYTLLTHPQQGMCASNGPTPIHECKSINDFNNSLFITLNDWNTKNQLIFYFSGHGDIRGNQYCLKIGLSNLDWYPFNNLMNHLDMAGVRRAIIVLDACHSGAAAQGIKNIKDSISGAIQKENIPQGIAIIASSRKTQTSHEFSDGSSGVFTELLCTGIETSLDGKGTEDGYIYVEDIVTYINNKLETEEKYLKFRQRSVFSLNKAERRIWIAKGKQREDSTQSNTKQSHSSVRTPEELKFLYETTHPNRHPCREATTDDIDLELIEQYSNRVEPNLYDPNSLEEVLSKLKLYSPIQHKGRNVLHRSAVLCFHQRPEKIYPQAKAVFVIGRPRDSNFVREDISGSLSVQVKTLMEKVKRYSEKISNIAEDGLRREVEEFDLDVVRELISNAIAHRDYQSTGTVKVQITPEALEVFSPGKFLPELSWEKLIDCPASISTPVDEAISMYLVHLLVFEGIGRGFDLFKQYIKDNGSDSITYQELPGPTTYIRLLRRRQSGLLIQGGDNYITVNNSWIEKQIELTPPYENLGQRGITEHDKFVGRDHTLTELHQLLQQNTQVAIAVAVVGMGGVGKTELAIQYARQHLDDTYTGGVCFLSGKNFIFELIQYAHPRFFPKMDLTGLSETEQLAYCWQHWVEGEVLLIVDDVTDYRQQVKPYLPGSPRFKVLITTREQIPNVTPLNLDVLHPDETLKLLEFIIGDDRIKAEPETAQQLCQWLGYLPLGLELVGRYLAVQEDLSLAKMLQRLQRKRLKHFSLQNEDDAAETAKLGVAAAFELSWERLQKQPETQQLGCLLSLFYPDAILWDLVEAVYQCWQGHEMNLENIEDSRRKLVQLSLLQRTDEQKTYRLHQLLREFFCDKLEEQKDVAAIKQAFVTTMVNIASQIPDNITTQQIKQVEPAIKHIEEVANSLIELLPGEDLIQPFTRLGRFYEGQTLYSQAEQWLKEGVEIIKNRLGEEHNDVATSLNNLASLYQSQGRYGEAEPLLKQALEIFKKLLGEEHPDVATSLNNLAFLYSLQGRYEEVEPLYLQALEMYKKLLGEEHPDVALSLNNLAGLYYSQGRYEKAEPLYLQALEMRQKLLGSEHPSVPSSLNNLATLYRSQGKYGEAEPLYKQSLEMIQKLLGQEHPNVATSLNNLALLYDSQGRYEKAEPLYLQALEMYKKLLGPEHPDVATSLNNLAKLYYNQGYYAKAEPLYQQALELQRQVLGENHPSIGISLNNLAYLYFAQGQYTDAIDFLQKALSIFEATLGEAHSDTVSTRRQLEKLLEEIQNNEIMSNRD